MEESEVGNKRRNPSFVMLTRSMLRSRDWERLSSKAKLFYIHLKAKYNGSNNGEILLHYSELKKVRGISAPSTISKAIDELISKGWILKEREGKFMKATRFRLTGRCDTTLG
jgi:DNA-binding MarR family transcriptional regulator